MRRISFGARTYNASIGRFDGVDALGDKRLWATPYNFAQNNPLNRLDPNGTLDEPCCGDGLTQDPFLFAKVAVTAFYDTKHAIYNTALRAFGSDLRAGYKFENGQEVFETAFTKAPAINSVKEAIKETVSAVADIVSIIPGGSTEGKLLSQTSKSQTSRAVKTVVAETNAGKGNITSKHTLTESEALEAGVSFAGKNAQEIGKSGSGVYRSQTANKDGTINQFRMDANSVAGSHSPNVPHVHLEVIDPTKKNPIVNNHIPIKK